MSKIAREQLQNFKNEIEKISSNVTGQRSQLSGEENTKMTIINPILRALGYNTESVNDVDTELSANIFPNAKASEKVDYAIKKDENVVILIEAKACDNPLDKPEKEFRQLYDYHNKFEKCKFGIITNGIKWICYHEIEKNKLDYNPFFIFNLFKHSDSDLENFLKLGKEHFTEKKLAFTARKTKMSTLFKARLLELIDNPLEMRVLFTKQYNSCGIGKVLAGSEKEEEITDCIRNSLNSIFTQKIIEKQRETERKLIEEEEAKSLKARTKTEFTKEEHEALLIIRAIAAEDIDDINRISQDDRIGHCNIIIDGKKRKKKICALHFNNEDKKYIELNGRRIDIKDLSEIYKHKNEIKTIVQSLV